MDFSTSFYDSTVEDNFYPPAPSSTVISASELSILMLEILTVRHLHPLCELYFKYVSKFTGIHGLAVNNGEQSISLGRISSTSSNCIRLPMPETCRANDTHCIASYSLVSALSPEQYQWLTRLHQLFAQQFANIVQQQRFEEAATKDSLTGLGNRNGFDDALKRFISRAQRRHSTFSLLVIDLDNFKQVNDKFGHSEGDLVLINTAGLITNALRGEDEAFRFGGDEFCCLLECQTIQQLNAAAERLQQSFKGSGFLIKHRISASLGGALYTEGDDNRSLFDRADKALYQVKERGKDSFKAA